MNVKKDVFEFYNIDFDKCFNKEIINNINFTTY